MKTNDDAISAMPHYIGQKMLQAEQITGWTYIDAETIQVHLANETMVNIQVGVFAREMPDIDDYLVRYADGYWSWSPRKVFEDVYHRIEAPKKELDDAG